MEITNYLNESLQVNEDRMSDKALVKITKYLKKETLDMSKNGFGAFGKDGKSMFVEFYRRVLFGGFSIMNVGDLVTINKRIGKTHIVKIDPKRRSYMDSKITNSEMISRVSSKITSICKWDATTFSKAMTSFFESQGIRGMYVSDGIDEN